MNALEGWKTIIVAAVSFIYGLLDKFALLPENISVEDTATAIMTLATVFFGLRLVTKKKVGGGQI